MTDNEIIAKYKKYEPFFGNWYIRRFVGEGGFAKVFEIVRTDFGDEYTSALKIISVSNTKTEIRSMRSEGMSEMDIRESLRGIVEDTVKEIKLMYKLRGNGNIVGYEDHAVIEHEDGMGWDILIKMEFLTSLSDYIEHQRGQISKRDIIRLGIDICKALETCQKYNIIHRDIKADNIFVSETGDFKLGDFGIARIIERKDMDLSKKGTFTYMAPEVYKGQTYTSAVDIYSLGMVMYRLMNNNRAPFLPAYPKPVSLDERDRALMLRMSGEKLPKPSQIGKSRLTEIVMKACAYRPEDRYSSPVSMRQELDAILYDKEEVTNDEQIMIYEEWRAGSTYPNNRGSSSGTQDGDKSTEVLQADDATEVLRGEDDATEVLRETDDATEVLHEENDAANVSAQVNPSHESPVCGANQKEEAEEEQNTQKRQTDQSSSGYAAKGESFKKMPMIVGICAAVLVVAVIIGVSVNFSSANDSIDTKKEFVPMEDIETYDIAEPMTIALNYSEDGSMHYCLASIGFSINTKSVDYKTYGSELSQYEILIKDIIYSIFANYSLEEARGNEEKIKDEILANVQQLFDSDFIFEVSFSSILYQ